MLMKGPVLGLILLVILGSDAHWLAGTALTGLLSECPTLNVEAPKDVDKSELIFKAIVSGPKLTNGSLKYKWSVDGGEMKDGQGTASVTIINFNLRKKSVTVVVEVEGLPARCASRASCTISV